MELPLIIQEKNMKDFQKMIQRLDEDSKGYVEGKALCTYLCLGDCKIFARDKISDYIEELSNAANEEGFISQNSFVDVSTSFFLLISLSRFNR